MSHPDEGLIHAWLDGELDGALRGEDPRQRLGEDRVDKGGRGRLRRLSARRARQKKETCEQQPTGMGARRQDELRQLVDNWQYNPSQNALPMGRLSDRYLQY